ncbi:TPA: hypothetical protein N0F65_003170 [Lagenidium giganteum]|uniref:Uncharacterized protein n=1 Tax=Lagenidium giganteum TaxID=4803 RepID=A0AAV2ZC73_9STRA|nr:TPA: hypothetical protein N0F65_003170 [Lagenidium giganteum]
MEARTSIDALKKVFCEGRTWKRIEIEAKWEEYEGMTPAVD